MLFGNLLFRLLWIVAAAATPAALVLVFLQGELQRNTAESAGAEALRLARAVQTELAGIADTTNIVLDVVARHVPDPETACRKYLSDRLRLVPRYVVLAAFQEDGTPICGTTTQAAMATLIAHIPPDLQSGFGDREAASADLPALLPYIRRQTVDGRPVILLAALRQDWLADHFQFWDRSIIDNAGATAVRVADRTGRIILQIPPEAKVDWTILPTALMRLLQSDEAGVASAADVNMPDRLIGYAPGRNDTRRLTALVDVTQARDALSDSGARHAFVLLLLGVLLSFGAMALAGQYLVRRPMRDLLAAARLWARGNLDVRLPIKPTDHSEFGRIARAFNNMAISLSREAEQRQALLASMEERVQERTRELMLSRDRLQVALGEQAKSEASLRQAQKMQAVGQLAGGIAHDFNNLLTALISALDMLSPRLPESDARARRLLDSALQAADRGARLTSQLLTFSRRQRLMPVAADLNEIIQTMLSLLRTTLGKTITLQLDLADDFWPALVDPHQLEAAILNLALNARDAMSASGTLTIATFCVHHLDRRPDRPADLQPGDYVTISVADTGSGMPPEVLARAVEPFFTTKRPGQGSGLGLSQVHGLAAQSGGGLFIESRRGQGTKVSLFLPRAASGIAAAIPISSSRQIVLVVDDDADVRALTGDMLIELGHTPVLVSDAASALEELRRPEPVHVMLADFAMPGMNGVELIQRASQLRPGIATILVTGHTDVTAIGASPDQPVLRKPYTVTTLHTVLEQVFNRALDRIPAQG